MQNQLKPPLLFLILTLITCGGQGKTGPTNQPDTISAFGIILTEESPPRDVARLLIQALDNDDEQILTKLVAVKYEAQAIARIRQQLAALGKKLTPEKIAVITAAGWRGTYLSFTPGRTRITGEIILGETAYVNIIATTIQGKEQPNAIKMVREDNRWKIPAAGEWLPHHKD